MDTHELARDRIEWALSQQGFDIADSRAMLKETLRLVKAQPTSCVDIVQGLLGLEWEYVSPLTQPKREMYLSETGWR